MAREALKRDLLNGISSDLLTDDDHGGFKIVHSQNIDELLKRNRDLEELHSAPGRDMRLAASIPVPLWNELVHLGIADDPEALKKWLNRPENEPFRVWKGRM